MARQQLKLDCVRVYSRSGDTTPFVFNSLAEVILDQRLGCRMDLVFYDERGQEVILTIHNAEYGNIPSFLTGTDFHRIDGLIEIPVELHHNPLT